MLKPRRIGSMLWICCAQFFVAEQVARSAWQLPYHFATNYISDLGRTDCTALVRSPGHAVMNSSFTLQGVLIVCGAMLLGKIAKLSTLLLIACGVGTILVGSAPSNLHGTIHEVGAVVHLLGGGLGIMVVGFGLPQGSGWGSVALGLVIVTATLLLADPAGVISMRLGAGTLERVAAYGITGWLVLMGMRSSLPKRHTSGVGAGFVG